MSIWIFLGGVAVGISICWLGASLYLIWPFISPFKREERNRWWS